MTAVIPSTSTATPPPDGRCISTTPTALDSERTPISWQQTTTDIDLDALPSDTLVVENGQITPIGKPVIAKMTKELADICRQADDPQAALQVVLEVIPKRMAEIASRRIHVEPSPLRTALTSLIGPECLARRPGRDPLTGDRMDGQRDTEDTRPDRLPCTQQHGHSGHHRDALGRNWHRAEASA